MVCEQAVAVSVRVHGADDGLVSAQRVRYALHDSGRRGVCQAEPVALRVPLLVLSTGRGGGVAASERRQDKHRGVAYMG